MLACNSEDLLIKYDFPSNLQKLLNSFIHQLNGTIGKFQINSHLGLDIKCYCNTKQLCKERTFINEDKSTFHFILF